MARAMNLKCTNSVGAGQLLGETPDESSPVA